MYCNTQLDHNILLFSLMFSDKLYRQLDLGYLGPEPIFTRSKTFDFPLVSMKYGSSKLNFILQNSKPETKYVYSEIPRGAGRALFDNILKHHNSDESRLPNSTNQIKTLQPQNYLNLSKLFNSTNLPQIWNYPNNSSAKANLTLLKKSNDVLSKLFYNINLFIMNSCIVNNTPLKSTNFVLKIPSMSDTNVFFTKTDFDKLIKDSLDCNGDLHKPYLIQILLWTGHCDLALEIAIRTCSTTNNWGQIIEICNLFQNFNQRRLLELVNLIMLYKLKSIFSNKLARLNTEDIYVLYKCVDLLIKTDCCIKFEYWSHINPNNFIEINKIIVQMIMYMLWKNSTIDPNKFIKNFMYHNDNPEDIIHCIKQSIYVRGHWPCPWTLTWTSQVLKILMVSYLWAQPLGGIKSKTLFKGLDELVTLYYDLSYVKYYNHMTKLVYNSEASDIFMFLLDEYYYRYVRHVASEPHIGSILNFDFFVKNISDYLYLPQNPSKTFNKKRSLDILDTMSNWLIQNMAKLINYSDTVWLVSTGIVNVKDIDESDSIKTLYKKVKTYLASFSEGEHLSLEYAKAIVSKIKNVYSAKSTGKDSLFFGFLFEPNEVRYHSLVCNLHENRKAWEKICCHIHYLIKLLNEIVESYILFGSKDSVDLLIGHIKYLFDICIDFYKVRVQNIDLIEISDMVVGLVSIITNLYSKLKYISGGLEYQATFSSWNTRLVK